MMGKSFYDLAAISLKGKEISMADYKGKVVLVVNTASKCGFTPQLEGLEALYEKYSEKGLVILGFPCNQFANQEPGDEKSIEGGCMLNYGVTFQMFSKIEVNGSNEHPVYAWLKSQKNGKGQFAMPLPGKMNRQQEQVETGGSSADLPVQARRLVTASLLASAAWGPTILFRLQI